MKNFFYLTTTLFVIITSVLPSLGQKRYWVEFTDKNNDSYSLASPEAFLSERAIERRKKQSIEIDSTDLPVNEAYLDSLRAYGFVAKHTSRWLNAASIEVTRNKRLAPLSQLSFVKKIYPVGNNTTYSSALAMVPQSGEEELNQVEMLGGDVLHSQGFKGEGLHIAVLDGGFYKANENPILSNLFDNGQVIETFDFEENDDQVYEDSEHGAKVLSVMGGFQEGTFSGTAPEANYYLFRTEVGQFERRTEEDNWIAAAEYADEVGVDIINTSLGYSVFDDPADDYTYEDMDGNTTAITRAADMAAAKGILVVVSAGNEGNGEWRYITAPADGDSVLTVGAVDQGEAWASFSSVGPTADNRIKPDVAALGSGTTAAGSSGSLIQVSGTSFSAPLIAGMSACLWQKMPEMTNWQLIEKIRNAGSQSDNPDNYLGYGIPNFAEAAGLNTTVEMALSSPIQLYPNPFTKELTLKPLPSGNNEVSIRAYSIEGILKWQKEIKTSKDAGFITFTPNLSAGLYIIIIEGDKFSFQQKLMKE
jgi:hypothetical protein